MHVLHMSENTKLLIQISKLVYLDIAKIILTVLLLFGVT